MLGLAPDGGLYVPETIPRLPETFWAALRGHALQELAMSLLAPYVENEIPRGALQSLVDEAFDFPAPLVRLAGEDHVLELFHGPTLAFKDFGARFLARALAWFHGHASQPLTVLVATSGDTGSAVAHGFHGVAGVRVVVLFPRGRISEIQERQITTLGGNVAALEVDGTFDDCQRLVKLAFEDDDLRSRLALTSANSISVGRLLPQMVYYAHACAQLEHARGCVFAVPSGNFGNLTAGVLAWRMGLPVERMIAATNANDVVPHYLAGSDFRPRASVATLTNAMDVGDPSNFARLRWIFGDDGGAMRASLWGVTCSDAATVETIREVHARFGYVLDPHTAVAWRALGEWRRAEGGTAPGIALATAHPAKFRDTVERATSVPIVLPARLRGCLERDGRAEPLGSDLAALREWLVTSPHRG